MNSLKVILLCSLPLVYGYGLLSKPTYREESPDLNCNATYPIYRNIQKILPESILSGDNVTLSQQEKCFVKCDLQKRGILDENSNVQKGLELVDQFVSRDNDAYVKYSDILVAEVYNIMASTRAIEDTCEKAYQFIYRLMESTMVIVTAKALEGKPALKRNISDAIETGQVAGGVKKLWEYAESVKSRHTFA